jgi:hypothetical protein
MSHFAPPQLPNTVLLTHLPSFLHSVRAVREWMGPCGSARTVLFLPLSVDPMEDIVMDKEVSEETESSKKTKTITALVTLSHADAAAKLMAAFRHFQQKLSAASTEAATEAEATTEQADAPQSMSDIQAYLVPNHPDIPLKPVTMDPETALILGDRLFSSWQSLSQGNSSNKTVNAAVATDHATTTVTTSSTTATSAMDGVVVDKNNDDAQANQNYDDDDDGDPLEAPAVLAAVRDFRRRLEQQQGSKSTRRKELVALKLQEMLPVVRQRVQEEATRPPQAMSVGIPPPPPAAAAGGGGGALPPPPVPLPVPPSAAENAPRGVSNLPAWMTKQEPEIATTETETEPPLKRPRLGFEVPSLEGNTDQKFPAMDPNNYLLVKQAIEKQCLESLGDPVASSTLVDFIYNKVVAESLVSPVLQEVQEVLEDEAAQFVQTLWEKVHELAAASGNAV